MIQNFIEFIVRRETIRYKKEVLKLPPPWTKDPILQKYKFCNVRREDDRVTRWLATNWRNLHAADPDLWFAMCVARFINWPPTLEYLGYPVPWNRGTREHYQVTIDALRARGEKVFSSAYIVSTNGRKGNKWEYLSALVLTPLWQARNAIRPTPDDTLESFHTRLQGYSGMGSFLAAQVVADVKYVPPLKSTTDWWTFAASGPGSRRGLNRVLGLPVITPWVEGNWRMELFKLQEKVNAKLKKTIVGELHAQDLQNCLCEYFKYCRGYSKQKYVFNKEEL